MKEPGRITKLFATIGVFWLLWLALAIATGLPGPLHINR